MDKAEFQERLSKSKNYREIFDLVKASVKNTLGIRRSGLMLYLEDLPLRVGAFHQIGSNGIVLNRRLLERVPKIVKSTVEVNSFLFTILLHEYLHSLGYLDEGQVRRLVYEISIESLGSEHPAAQMAVKPPLPIVSLLDGEEETFRQGLELIKDFDEVGQKYIV